MKLHVDLHITGTVELDDETSQQIKKAFTPINIQRPMWDETENPLPFTIKKGLSQVMKRMCKADLCSQDQFSKGLCRKHYMQQYYKNKKGNE